MTQETETTDERADEGSYFDEGKWGNELAQIVEEHDLSKAERKEGPLTMRVQRSNMSHGSADHTLVAVLKDGKTVVGDERASPNLIPGLEA